MLIRFKKKKAQEDHVGWCLTKHPSTVCYQIWPKINNHLSIEDYIWSKILKMHENMIKIYSENQCL